MNTNKKQSKKTNIDKNISLKNFFSRAKTFLI